MKVKRLRSLAKVTTDTCQHNVAVLQATEDVTIYLDHLRQDALSTILNQ